MDNQLSILILINCSIHVILIWNGNLSRRLVGSAGRNSCGETLAGIRHHQPRDAHPSPDQALDRDAGKPRRLWIGSLADTAGELAKRGWQAVLSQAGASDANHWLTLPGDHGGNAGHPAQLVCDGEEAGAPAIPIKFSIFPYRGHNLLITH